MTTIAVTVSMVAIMILASMVLIAVVAIVSIRLVVAGIRRTVIRSETAMRTALVARIRSNAEKEK